MDTCKKEDILDSVWSSLTKKESLLLKAIFERFGEIAYFMDISGYEIRMTSMDVYSGFMKSDLKGVVELQEAEGESFREALKKFLGNILARETRHASIYFKPSSLMIMSLDDFKSIEKISFLTTQIPQFEKVSEDEARILFDKNKELEEEFTKQVLKTKEF